MLIVMAEVACKGSQIAVNVPKPDRSLLKRCLSGLQVSFMLGPLEASIF